MPEEKVIIPRKNRRPMSAFLFFVGDKIYSEASTCTCAGLFVLQIRQLVETFGPLKTFHVLKKDTDDSQVALRRLPYAVSPCKCCLLVDSSLLHSCPFPTGVAGFHCGILPFAPLCGFAHFFLQVVCVIEYCDTDSQQQAMEILHTNSPYKVVTAEQAINEGAVSSFLKDKISLAGSSAAPALLRPQVCTRVLVLHNIVTPQDVRSSLAHPLTECPLRI